MDAPVKPLARLTVWDELSTHASACHRMCLFYFSPRRRRTAQKASRKKMTGHALTSCLALTCATNLGVGITRSPVLWIRSRSSSCPLWHLGTADVVSASPSPS